MLARMQNGRGGHFVLTRNFKMRVSQRNMKSQGGMIAISETGTRTLEDLAT